MLRLSAPVGGADREPYERADKQSEQLPEGQLLDAVQQPAQQVAHTDDPDHDPEADRPALRWISRSPDPNDPSIEWLVLYGPGAEKTPQHEPLGRLAPFAGDRSLAIETGPAPRWDRDGVSLRFLAPHAPVLLERRPLVVAAGPELAPDLGLAGEICASRRSALRAIEALGA